jgi:hypothetical protein
MIVLKVLATFCLATFCLVSAATLTENELKLELAKLELLKDTIGTLSETISEIEAQLKNDGEEELIGAGYAPEGKQLENIKQDDVKDEAELHDLEEAPQYQTSRIDQEINTETSSNMPAKDSEDNILIEEFAVASGLENIKQDDVKDEARDEAREKHLKTDLLDLELLEDSAMAKGGCPQRLLVQCRRNCNYGASQHQSRIFGCYTRTGDINGRPAWTKSKYSKAIWWEPGWRDWAIGDKKDIGGKMKRAKAHRSHRCPNLIGGYYWEYYDGNRFVHAGRGLGVFGGC